MDKDKTINIEFSIQGLGYTSAVKYANALSYWNAGVDTVEEKSAQIINEFTDLNSDINLYYTNTYGEENDENAGSISISMELDGESGVVHTYETNNSIDWATYPDRTTSINGRIVGTGVTAAEKIAVGIDYYDSVDFDTIVETVAEYEMSGGTVYLRNQSLSINHKTGEINYQKEYKYNEANYLDTWTIDYNNDEENNEVTIGMQGTIAGLSSDKTTRWSDTISAFNTIFSSDDSVWNSKVSTILGANTPPSGYITNRSVTYDQTNGTIGYNYNWSSTPDSGVIDYDISGNYSTTDDFWTITLNGIIHGYGKTISERITNAVSIKPQEYTAWTYAYNNFVSLLDNGVSDASDNPALSEIINSRTMISRSENLDKKTGIYTFSFVWSCSDSAYTNIYNDSYSWDEASATETVTRTGTIKATAVSDLEDGWAAVYNDGDPDIPSSVYASRHINEITGTDTLPTSSPVSGTGKFTTVASFNREAILVSSTYSIDEVNMTLNYTFVFIYKAYNYSYIPLWVTDLSVNMDNVKPVPIWAKHNIIGKRTGPVYQDMTAITGTSFNITIRIATTKRKADKFGQYLQILFEEYSDRILNDTMINYSGYGVYNSSSDESNQNCYIESDTFSRDITNGGFTRTITINMLENLSS